MKHRHALWKLGICILLDIGDLVMWIIEKISGFGNLDPGVINGIYDMFTNLIVVLMFGAEGLYFLAETISNVVPYLNQVNSFIPTATIVWFKARKK